MRDRLGAGTTVGYCTNVHPGASLAETKANLETHALAVKEIVAPNEPMGVGLWLAANVAKSLVDEKRLDAFAAWLHENGLLTFTLNGFPYGNFHEPRVKHRVYEPDWSTTQRRDYTIDLVRILHAILPAGVEGSISTLPIGWPDASVVSPIDRDLAAERLLEMAHYLSHFERATGRLIHVDLEPEPGCLLQTSDDVVRFFDERLFPRAGDLDVSRYLRVCHDICHAAVMYESQADVYAAYERAGIRVGKVQVSSAVRLVNAHTEALRELSAFAEDRYLHQTVVHDSATDETMHFDDLPAALAAHAAGHVKGDEWRVHFHVPLHVTSFGSISTTQDEVRAWIDVDAGRCPHVEVETYAWSVLPEPMRPQNLATGIAEEIQWLLREAGR